MAAITYQEAREQYPNQWIVFEVLESSIEEDHLIIRTLEVKGGYAESHEMWQQYKALRHTDRRREYGFYHTSNPELVIEVRHRYGGLRLHI